jgi:signal peptidase I
VKRLVALPGSRVELQNGELRVQGIRVEEPYVALVERGYSGAWDTGAGYFLLGDNRRESHDSRAWGSLAADRLEARLLVGRKD